MENLELQETVSEATETQVLSAQIFKDVDMLVRDVPVLMFNGSLESVIEEIKEFEDGFGFVPVMKPRVEGDFYLVNNYKRDNNKILPEYSQTSQYYQLLKSNETLREIQDTIGQNVKINAIAGIQKQISVLMHDEDQLNQGDENHNPEPMMYYVNSYNRTTREKIILGFAMLNFTYMHRQSGTRKDDFENIVQFLQDFDRVDQMKSAINDYPIDRKAFAIANKKAQLPIKRIAFHKFGVTTTQWKEAEDKNQIDHLMFNIFVNHFVRREGSEAKPSLRHVISWFHAMYHFNTSHGRFDVATKMLDLSSTYITKVLMQDAKLAELI